MSPSFYVFNPSTLPPVIEAEGRQDAGKAFAKDNRVDAGKLAVIRADDVAYVNVRTGTAPVTVTDDIP